MIFSEVCPIKRVIMGFKYTVTRFKNAYVAIKLSIKQLSKNTYSVNPPQFMMH